MKKFNFFKFVGLLLAVTLYLRMEDICAQNNEEMAQNQVERHFVDKGEMDEEIVANNKHDMKLLNELLTNISLSPGTYEENARVRRLIKETEKKVHLLQEGMEKRESELQDEIDERLKDFKETIEEQMSELKEKSKDMSVELQDELNRKAAQLRFDAAQGTIGLINKAEQEALKLRMNARKEALKEKFEQEGLEIPEEKVLPPIPERWRARFIVSEEVAPFQVAKKAEEEEVGAKKEESVSTEPVSTEPVSIEWKNEVSRNFYQAMSYMKIIILEGESPDQVQDFSKRFADQNLWFDTTLRGTRLVNDDNYRKIMNKHQKLAAIVRTQKKAHEFLETLIKNFNLTHAQKNQARLIILYDLNNLIQRRLVGDAASLPSITDDEIKVVVKKTVENLFYQSKLLPGKFADVEMVAGRTQLMVAPQVISPKVIKLREELRKANDKLENFRERLKQSRLEKEKFERDIQEKMHEKIVGQLELELELKKAEQKLAKVEEQKRFALRKVDHVGEVLETSGRQEVLLQLELRQAEDEVERLENEVKSVREKVEKDMKRKFLAQLAERGRKNLELEILLKSAEQKALALEQEYRKMQQENLFLVRNVKKISKEVQDAQHREFEQTRQREEAQAQAQLIEEIFKKSQDTIRKYREGRAP